MCTAKCCKLGLVLTELHYNCYTDFFARCKLHEAFKLLNKRSDMYLDKVTYISVISGLCRSGHMKEAYKIFTEMLRRGHTRSVVTYTCLIDGYCKTQLIGEANILFDIMKRKRIALDQITYNILVDIYYRSEKVDRYYETFQETKGMSCPRGHDFQTRGRNISAAEEGLK